MHDITQAANTGCMSTLFADMYAGVLVVVPGVSDHRAGDWWRTAGGSVAEGQLQ